MAWHLFATLPFLLAVAGLATTCTSADLGIGGSAAAAGPKVVEAGATRLELTPLAEGLAQPWSLAFLPDGRMLVTERPGRLRIIDANGRLDPKPVEGVPEVSARGQGGLLDVLPAADFASSGTIYLSYAAPLDGGSATRVMSARLADGVLSDRKVLVTAEPVGSTTRHYGSRLVLAGDGSLLISTGDRGQMDRSQKLDDMAGKVLRVLPDGGVPQDNPFAGRADAKPQVFAYGVRNAQGMATNPWTGEVWYHEHGARGGDEVNILRQGANYGWPLVTHGVDYSGLSIGSGKTAPGVTDPVHVWVPSIAPSGMAFYDADLIPGWRGDLLVGALAGRLLVRLELDGDRITAEHRLLAGEIGRIRDVRVGPDGAVYLLPDSNPATIWRLTPAQG